MTSSFYTINSASEYLFTDKNSKFLGYCFEVYSEEEIKSCLAELKIKHPKANHHCYAYRLGLDLFNYRANDDGEPSGSAGKPILGQIDSFGLTNALVVVVRYFGGTKLGVSGLISAYKNAAQIVLEEAGKKEVELTNKMVVTCNYLEVNELLNFLKKMGVADWQQEYAENCKITFNVKDSELNSLASWLETNKLKFSSISNF